MCFGVRLRCRIQASGPRLAGVRFVIAPVHLAAEGDPVRRSSMLAERAATRQGCAESKGGSSPGANTSRGDSPPVSTARCQ
jgi:hypothetical protein